jgi:arsenic resistance protein ArsH
MKVLIFNGALEKRTLSTSYTITAYLKQQMEEKGNTVQVFNLSEASIPFLDITLKETPRSVNMMVEYFRNADVHIWLTPLYHGGMTGAMKNCLDWMEVSSKEIRPYLTGKTIGLICWADGAKAMLGIQSMDMVAKSLRAWVHPYSIPIVKDDLYNLEYTRFSDSYKLRFDKIINLLTNELKP